jgi:hypothetical protein
MNPSVFPLPSYDSVQVKPRSLFRMGTYSLPAFHKVTSKGFLPWNRLAGSFATGWRPGAAA